MPARSRLKNPEPDMELPRVSTRRTPHVFRVATADTWRGMKQVSKLGLVRSDWRAGEDRLQMPSLPPSIPPPEQANQDDQQEGGIWRTGTRLAGGFHNTTQHADSHTRATLGSCWDSRWNHAWQCGARPHGGERTQLICRSAQAQKIITDGEIGRRGAGVVVVVVVSAFC